jgi:hypothetical protein
MRNKFKFVALKHTPHFYLYFGSVSSSSLSLIWESEKPPLPPLCPLSLWVWPAWRKRGLEDIWTSISSEVHSFSGFVVSLELELHFSKFYSKSSQSPFRYHSWKCPLSSLNCGSSCDLNIPLHLSFIMCNLYYTQMPGKLPQLVSKVLESITASLSPL